VKWISLPDDINVAAFDDLGLSITDGFHTLTTTTPLTDPPTYYNAFVYSHGPSQYAYRMSYAYLAGYDCK